VATVNLAVGGRAAEIGRSVTVESTGKVLVAGPFEHDPSAPGDAARDTDVALSRFDEGGKLDATFGTAGTVRLDLGTGAAVSASEYVGDTMWGITVMPDDRVLTVAARRADAAGRTDRDPTVLMLGRDGRPDPSFASGGTLTVDIGGGSESPRTAVIQPDGRIVIAGYTRSPGGAPVVSPLLVRRQAAGRPRWAGGCVLRRRAQRRRRTCADRRLEGHGPGRRRRRRCGPDRPVATSDPFRCDATRVVRPGSLAREVGGSAGRLPV
jgi:uncharacterized delta-60 repeat protein